MTPPSAASERLRGEGVVCLSSIDWDFIWQGHQETMRRLASDGNPVLFVENTGVRTPRLGDIPRLWARIRNWWNGVGGFREAGDNLIVLAPILLPFPYSPAASWVNGWLMERAVSNWMRATKRNSPILWTFLPTPLTHEIISRIDPALVVYYCVDDFSSSSEAAGAVETAEAELFRRADLVFVTSHRLLLRARSFRPNAHFFPFGVDFDRFEAKRTRQAPEPHDIAGIPHPRIGYIGGVHRWVDLELVRAAAAARPELHFVFIGPIQTDVSILRGLPNVHFLGSRPHSDLPDYIAAFDCGIIPYRLARYTESVYPTKLNEYFAMGLPVVSTPLPEVIKYNEANEGLVAVAVDPQEFLTRLDESLERRDLARNSRIAAARRNGWDSRLAEMSGLLARRLDERRADPKVLGGLLPRLAHHYRAATVAIGAAALLGVAAVRWTPLVWLMSEPLKLSQAPEHADAAVVLGGGAGESGQIGQGHEERANRALQLYQQGYVKKIVFCSSSQLKTNELEIMRAIALAKGVLEEDILAESRGGGTLEMVRNANRLAREEGWSKVLLVSSPYHMRRAVLVWRKQAPDLAVIPTPAHRSGYYGYHEGRGTRSFRRGPTWAQFRGLMQEWFTLIYYACRGWL